ncbi:LEA type 2 family protein [Elongatibacter sediminis]|uniref:LEA type 2 family protein n=1 Tax=Elongatibacter sediminis TaxID=3119006 RepID=A0AAW9RCM3_9GAMM
MELRTLLRGSLIAIFAFACTACGSSLVKGQSPFVSISSMTASGDSIEAAVNIRNINDVPMNIDRLVLTMQSKNTVLLQHTGSPGLSIDPNTTEDVTLSQTADESSRTLLDSLQSGGVDSLSFSLEGRVQTVEDGNLSFRHQGYLFRVPGKPGQFRATSSRSSER